MQTTANTIVITGGGSGIGRELAQRLNALGNTVIVTGRRIQPLQETIADRPQMHAFELDIDDPVAIAAFTQELLAQFPQTNVLINNAGIMRVEDLSHANSLHDAEAQITTNLLGTIRMTNALIEHLKQQAHAAVLTVSSGLAFVPLVRAPVYSATKAAIHAYSLSLRQQLQGQVEVIELVPPAVQTELTPGQATREGYLPLQAFMDELMALLYTQPTPPEIVVQRAHLQRLAEREGRFEQAFRLVNGLPQQQAD